MKAPDVCGESVGMGNPDLKVQHADTEQLRPEASWHDTAAGEERAAKE